jgi:hypothetical protein
MVCRPAPLASADGRFPPNSTVVDGDSPGLNVIPTRQIDSLGNDDPWGGFRCFDHVSFPSRMDAAAKTMYLSSKEIHPDLPAFLRRS